MNSAVIDVTVHMVGKVDNKMGGDKFLFFGGIIREWCGNGKDGEGTNRRLGPLLSMCTTIVVVTSVYSSEG